MEHVLKKSPCVSSNHVIEGSTVLFYFPLTATLWLGAITSHNLEIRRLRLRAVE